MKYNTKTLSNGLRVIHLPSTSPVVYCGYQVGVGTRHELPGEEGLAHFCEHATFKGTSRRTAIEVINALEGVGGELNAFTTKESTTFYAAVLKSHFDEAVDLLTDIVFHSTYPQDELDREVEVVCDEIESYNDTPSELIYDDFENMVFSGHPLGHNILGKAEQLRTYTSEDLLRFTRRGYRPDNAVFFAYGNLKFEELLDSLERRTEGVGVNEVLRNLSTLNSPLNDQTTNLPISQTTKRPISQTTSPLNDQTTSLPNDQPNSSTIVRHLGTHQAHVMTGCRTFSFDDERRMPLYLLNNILGGPALNARLNLTLRERHGLVYTVESTMTCYSDTGCWSVYFGCDPDDVDKCRQLVHREMLNMMEQPLTSEQLRAAKQQLKGQLAIACDNREQFALDFGKSFLHKGRERDLDKLMAQIDAITADSVLSVARQVFAPEGLMTLIYDAELLE